MVIFAQFAPRAIEFFLGFWVIVCIWVGLGRSQGFAVELNFFYGPGIVSLGNYIKQRYSIIGFQLSVCISNVFIFAIQQLIFVCNFRIEILEIVFTAIKFLRVLICILICILLFSYWFTSWVQTIGKPSLVKGALLTISLAAPLLLFLR